MTPPDVLLYDWGDDAHPKLLLWKPPDIPDSVGPEAVGNLLCAFREFVRTKRAELSRPVGSLGDISDAGVRALLLLAYRASFLTDEGRPVRARIAIRSERRPTNLNDAADAIAKTGLDVPFLLQWQLSVTRWAEALEDGKLYQCRLAPPTPLDEPKVIAKFAPVLRDPGSAMTVVEQGNQLVVTGIAALDREDDGWEILRMPRNPQPSAALLVEILGPGHLRVREDEAEFVLFADHLENRTGALWEKPVRQWLEGLSRVLVCRMKARSDYSPAARLFSETDPTLETAWNAPHVDVTVSLTRLLRSAVSLGHGGAFAFLPDVPGAPIRLTHPLKPIDLGAALLDAWGAECAVWAAYRQDVEAVLRAAQSKRVHVQRWLRLLKTVAHFTAADGCVVFDKSLMLHGFGGKIVVGKQSGAPSRRCIDLRHDRETSREDVLRLYGTRHGSAFELCEAVSGAVVFVISQDGDLRLFASDDDTVYYATGLHP